jgi:hypothetical protein
MKSLLVVVFCLFFQIGAQAQQMLQADTIARIRLPQKQSRYHTGVATDVIGTEIFMLKQQYVPALKSNILNIQMDTVLEETYIERINLADSTVKKIRLPRDIAKQDLLCYGSTSSGTSITYFLLLKGASNAVCVVLAIVYDTKLNSFDIRKIYETEPLYGPSGNWPVYVLLDLPKKQIGIVEMVQREGRVAFDFVIKDSALNIVSSGNNVHIDGVKMNEVFSFSIAGNGALLVDMRVKAEKWTIGRSRYVERLYIIKDGKAKQLDYYSAHYHTLPKVLIGADGEATIVYAYSENETKTEGLFIATIDCDKCVLRNINKISFAELGINVADMSIDYEDTLMQVSAVEAAMNGNLVVHMEKQYISTDNIYDYTTLGKPVLRTIYYTKHLGPGYFFCIKHSSNQLHGYLKLDYEVEVNSPYAPTGLNFAAGNDTTVLISSGKHLYSYAVNNRVMPLTFGAKSFTRNYYAQDFESPSLDVQNAYLHRKESRPLLISVTNNYMYVCAVKGGL